MKEHIKVYFIECLFFGKPKEGNPIPNYLLAVASWINILIIIISLIHLLNK
mgnify:CR=1 FL=1